MNFFLEHYWPHILLALSIILGVSACIHVAMTKREVRTAIGWVGVIILSPILGAVIYGLFGINRIRSRLLEEKQLLRDALRQDKLIDYDMYRCNDRQFVEHFSDNNTPNLPQNIIIQNLLSLKKLGDHLCQYSIVSGNEIKILEDGDAGYTAMLKAIEQAQYSILLESYIFNKDRMGKIFANALCDAIRRGVEVRVLIDAVGVRYSIPTIVSFLRRHNIKVAVFNGNIIMGLRLPYANLRTHRKILIIDRHLAFTGGLNIQEAFSKNIKGEKVAHDTHFQISGPAVLDLFHVAASDWYFATNERLNKKQWNNKPINPIKFPAHTGVYMRIVASGPTGRILATNQNMLIGAFSLARHHIRIMTPYFLPDRELISALVTAARRGVKVDIIIPDKNNLALVDRAMWAQFDQLLPDGCRIWRSRGTFNHSKLMTIDNIWSYVGSSNLDARSLRLNFEVDMEIFDKKIAEKIAKKIDKAQKNAKEVLLKHIKKRLFLLRLVNKIIWLGSPYL